AEVFDLHRRFARADDDPPGIDPARHRRQLRHAVAPERGENGVVVLPQKRQRFVDVHSAPTVPTEGCNRRRERGSTVMDETNGYLARVLREAREGMGPSGMAAIDQLAVELRLACEQADAPLDGPYIADLAQSLAVRAQAQFERGEITWEMVEVTKL